MQPRDLAPFLEQSVLRPDVRRADVDAACDAALLHLFRGVVVPSGMVHVARRRLLHTAVKVVSTAGFPHGTQAPDVKAHEAARAVAAGADEIDYVIAIGAAIDGDVAALVAEADAMLRAAEGRIVKAILEVGCLSEGGRTLAAAAVAGAGVPYVKTCTGFGPGVATPEDVALLCRAVAGKALVKASGGVRTREQVMELLQAGAAVVGTSHGPAICGGA